MAPSKSVGLLQPIDVDLADRCFPKPKCDPNAPFRTIDGSCNNLNFPVWGQANTANTRIIDADYSDGKYCIIPNIIILVPLNSITYELFM